MLKGLFWGAFIGADHTVKKIPKTCLGAALSIYVHCLKNMIVKFSAIFFVFNFKSLKFTDQFNLIEKRINKT